MKAVVHQDENGEITIYADDGIEVFWVDDRSSFDRIYRMDHRNIPEGMLDGIAGKSGDGSQGAVRLNAIMSEIEGRPHLRPVE